MKNIYFAHGVWDYGTERETRALEFIKSWFGEGASVLNPADLSDDFDRWKETFPDLALREPMMYFKGFVRMSDVVVYMPDDAMVGPGIAAEVLEALVHNIPVYRLRVLGDSVSIQDIHNHFDEFVMTIDEARAKNRA